MAFYTAVEQVGGKFLHRYFDDFGIEYCNLEDFQPDLYVTSKHGEYRGIRGEVLTKRTFDNIWEASKFCKEYADINSLEIHGNRNWWAQFIQKNYTGEVQHDPDKIRIANIDIETRMDKGFPSPKKAIAEITCITVGVFGGDYYVFSTKGEDAFPDNVHFTLCKDERTLLNRFLDTWNDIAPHIVTGWNIENFDIPYLIRRVARVLGEDSAEHFAPGKVRNAISQSAITEKEYKGDPQYSILGVAIVDYMKLYKKFTYKMRESYKLDYIGEVEGVGKKVDYSEYGNLDDLWEKNPQLYIEYNIQDVKLIQDLEAKKGLMALIIYLSYLLHIRFEDVFYQVRMWDTFIYNTLLAERVVVPPKVPHTKDEKYIGAYVADPIIGRHDWVVSFDLNSLYPHLIMQYNISPEVLIDREDVDVDMPFGVDDLVDKVPNLDFLGELDITMSANKQFFDKGKLGFLPKMMELLYNKRKTIKKQQLADEQVVEDITELLKARGEL